MQLSKLQTQPPNTIISVMSLFPGLSGSWHGSWNSFLRSCSGLQQPHAVLTIIFSTFNLFEEREDQLGFVYSILGLQLFKYLNFFFLMVESLERRAQPLEFNSSVNYRTTNRAAIDSSSHDDYCRSSETFQRS